MADVTLKYKGATIAELSESGSKTLETAGTYCEADILLEYVKTPSGVILPPNMLDGLTWQPGYFNTSGVVTSPSNNKELYSNEFIEVVPNEKYFIGQKSPLSNNVPLWMGNNYYDENKTFIARVMPDGFNNSAYCNPIWFSTFRTNATTKFIRVSFRSFGESSLYMCKASDFFEAIKDSAVNLVY